MYKDFKKSESLDTDFVGGSGIIWMFSGIVLGLLVGLAMYYFSNNNASALSMVGTVQNKIKQAQSSESQIAKLRPPSSLNTAESKTRVLYKPDLNTEKEQQRKTRFSYYAVLPTLDVPVGFTKPIDTRTENIANLANKDKSLLLEEIKTDKEIAQIEAKLKTELVSSGDFLLQVASFRKKSKAKVTRGRLSKKGIKAYIQEKKVKGSLWYRVVAGPNNENSVENWKTTVEKMGHRPLVISVR